MHRLRVLRDRMPGEGAQVEHMRAEFRCEETILTLVSDERSIRIGELAAMEARGWIEDKIRSDPFFGITYEPYPESDGDPELIRRMCRASSLAGVGPMAGVAGAVAEYAARKMAESGAEEAIVENGGDIALYSPGKKVPIGIYADDSVFRDVAYLVDSDRMTGICSSSATIGPSVSLGSSDLCTVFSDDVILADCCATALGNLVVSSETESLSSAAERIGSIEGVRGCVAVCGKKVAFYGDIPEMVPARFDAKRGLWQ